MTKRTRLFVFAAAGILIVGLGTGLVASYMGLQSFSLTGRTGPAELAYVPADARMVAYANVRDVMDSELRQKLMQLKPDTDNGADHFQQETGINVRTDIDHVVATVAGQGGPDDRPLVLARGNFDTAHIESLIRQKGGSVETYQGTRLITHPEGNVGVAFVEPGLVAVGTPAAVRRAIDTKASGADVTGNADVMRFVRDVEDGNAWAVARLDALTGRQPIPEELAKQLPAISWFAASGYVNGGFRGVMHAEARDEAAANDLRDVIRGFVALARMQTSQRAELADLMNSFELGGQGKTVSLGFAVPPEMIDALGALHAGRPRGPRPELPGAPDAPAAPDVPEPRGQPRRPAPPSL